MIDRLFRLARIPYGFILGLALAWGSTQAMAQNTWTGAVNNDWLIAGNWTDGVPVDSADTFNIFYLNGGSPTLNGVGTARRGWLHIGHLTIGAGGALTMSNTIEVGNQNGSDARLSIVGGGDLVSTAATIASVAGSSGEVLVSGVGSTWSVGAAEIAVGISGSGSLYISAGGVVSSGVGRIGSGTAGTGIATVTGAGSHWNLGSSDLRIGSNGTSSGELIVSDGGRVTSGQGLIGYVAATPGSVEVTGEDSIWDTGNASIYVGADGFGELSISAGGRVESNGGAVSAGTGGGSVEITGSGSAWDVGSGAFIVGFGGQGDLSILNGGGVVSAGGAVGGNNSGFTSTLLVSGEDSTWNAGTGTIFIGSSGSGVLTINQGGSVVSGAGVIASQASSTGLVEVDGSGSSWNLGTATLTVGSRNHGELEITAGAVVSSGAGTLGEIAGGSGEVLVSGTGSQWNTGAGNLSVGSLGTGTLTINAGGQVSTAAATVAANSSINLAGGTLSANSLHLTQATSSLSGWGTVTSNVQMSSNAVVHVTGGNLTTGLLFGQGAVSIDATRTLFIDRPAGSVVFTGALSGAGGLTKLGTGSTQVLSGNNASYQGPVFVREGTLRVQGAWSATNSVMVNTESNFSARYEHQVNNGASYVGVASHSSSMLGTRASFVAGTNATSLPENVSMRWRTASGSFGDVLELSGMNRVSGPAGSTDPFVLQMTYNLGVLQDTAYEDGIAAAGELFLGRLNNGQWENAVLGNSTGVMTFAGVGDWTDFGTAGLADDIGRWGVNTTTNTVWAVLDHNNSQFSPVPEPGTWLFSSVLLGVAGFCYARRRRRSMASAA